MIPKTGGKLRRLGIATVRDRVARAALKSVLEPIFEADFTLYGDHLVRAALARHGISVVATPGPIWERVPVPVPLTPALMADLYEGCGLGVTHIELLTGQPAATVAKRCLRWGIRLRKQGGRCPFLLRVQSR